MNLKDKVVVVTGAGKGIGRGIALAYAEHGARVILADRDSVSAEETFQLIGNSGGTSYIIQTDISKPEEIVTLFNQTVKRFSTVDILINNAGVSEWKSPYEVTVEDWDRIINTNLRSMFLCSREAAKIMRNHNGGSIVNISSTRAIMSEPFAEAYAASKGGVVALTHALAASFSSDGIQVNCISPGWIETGDYGKLREADHAQHFSNRVGLPEDVARACLFLTSGKNNFVNGTNLVIDGGMTKKMIYEP